MPKKVPPPPDKNLPEGDSFLAGTWFTLEDLMKRFKRSKSTINRWRRIHHLVCSKTDGTVLVNKDDVEQFLKDHRRIR